jgi:2-polyprenyl-3-methyl-5-hydroxy-6-metoxy-1,4-benzoquinol methylase
LRAPDSFRVWRSNLIPDPSKTYIIQGGVAGRERLRVLARVMAPSTSGLLDRLGTLSGLRCLDAGCGGGDVTQELARRAGPSGHVVGVDADPTKMTLAQSEAVAAGITTIEFRCASFGADEIEGPFDLVYSRFLLTHVRDPHAVVGQFRHLLGPGGRIAIEDIDFSGYFAYPDSAAHRRFAELYSQAARIRGADPDIGPRLPRLLLEHGFAGVEVAVSQPMGLRGEVKLITPITMENIAAAVTSGGLASAEEVASLAQELYAFAADETTIAGMPRIIQAWGRTAPR